jgi:hypothetical protein
MTSRTLRRATCSRTWPKSCWEVNSSSISARIRSAGIVVRARAWTFSA